MDVKLLRIDSRLLHGQVATDWAKNANVERILIVCDQAASDSIRKTLLIQAAPPGLKVHVLTLAKMIRLSRDERFSKLKVLILVENPIDAMRLVSGGVGVSSINLGSLSFDATRKMITETIAVNEQDIVALTWLKKRGIELDYRKVSSDPKRDLWKVLCDKGLVNEEQS